MIQKDWSAMSSKEKLERLRGIVENLEHAVARNSGRGNELSEQLRQIAGEVSDLKKRSAKKP
jgi:hypothetical protein